MYSITTYTRHKYLAITLSKTRFFSSATQLKPCRAGLGTGRVTHRKYCHEGPYFVLSFLRLLFCLFCGVIFKREMKSILSMKIDIFTAFQLLTWTG